MSINRRYLNKPSMLDIVYLTQTQTKVANNLIYKI